MVRNKRFCLLDEMSCLTRWRNVWFNFEPIITDAHHNQKLNSQCPDCLPSCRFELYTANAYKTVFDPNTISKIPSKKNIA